MVLCLLTMNPDSEREKETLKRIELRASDMLGKRSTVELHSQPPFTLRGAGKEHICLAVNLC